MSKSDHYQRLSAECLLLAQTASDQTNRAMLLQMAATCFCYREQGESPTIAEILKWCEDDGMTFPVILCTVSPKGSILANRIDGLGLSEVLAQHFEGGVFTTPRPKAILPRIAADYERLAEWAEKTQYLGGIKKR